MPDWENTGHKDADMPSTSYVHERLGSAVWRRFNARARPPRGPYDLTFAVQISNVWFHVSIMPERDKSMVALLSTTGTFPWNGRWRLGLEVGGYVHTFRPRHDQLPASIERVCDMIAAQLKIMGLRNTPTSLHLVVDNTKNS